MTTSHNDAAARSADDWKAIQAAERDAFIAAGGHAYPTHEDDEVGMTLREHYAGQAMQVMIQGFATRGGSPTSHIPELCLEAVRVADELLYALKHNKTGDQDDR
jgi:hypothetical protein